MDAQTLYAHAIAIEREAVERYTEFSWRMSDAGNDAAAEVFGTLARLEAQHLDELLKRAHGLKLPALGPQQYAWLDAAAPETAARELVFRLMTPRHALEIALAGEQRAMAFFEHVVLSADDAFLRALAAEMGADEAEHVALLEQLLETTPPLVDWASVYEKEGT